MLINKKLFGLILSLIFSSLLLCACASNSYTIKSEEKCPAEERALGETAYTVNIATNSYHLSTCYISNGIKEENKLITYDINFLRERGFTPCKKCID